MRRQGDIFTGILPFVLGIALLVGCFFLSAASRAGATEESETLQGSTAPVTPVTSVTESAQTTTGANLKKVGKPKHAKTKTPEAVEHTDPEKAAEGIGMPSAARKEYTGKTMSLDLMDADIRNVLRLIADLSGLNIVVEPDVTGKVTLKVEQVPWDQILDMVLAMNDLGKEQVGNVIRIAKQAKLRTEYLQQAEAIKAKQNLAETTRDLGELTTVYLPVNFAKPSEVAAKITDGKSERGKVAVDDRTSLIIYTDYPARIANARHLLGRLDRATPQVLIEARIVTLSSEVKRQLGVNLNFSSQWPKTPGVSSSQGFTINTPGTGLNPFTANIAAVIGQTLLNIDLQIQALQSLSQLRVVAAPRVMTLDNVKAVVTQGTQIPYLQVGDTAANITAVSFKDATLELAVTPHITPDRKVRMLINAKQDTVSATIYNIGNSGEPGIDTRKIQTELLVDDGNVVVIGGVISDNANLQRQSTPGLSDIPILGRLFKSDTTDDTKAELLIFISPKIVEVTKPYDKS